MTNFAVLTGDLITSSRLSAAETNSALTALQNAADHIAKWRPDLLTGFARRGGDGWQCAFAEPSFDLRAALYLRARLRQLGKGFATRISIARGPGDLPMSGDPNAASGPAFTASGRALETLTGPHAQMRHTAPGALAAATALADHIAQGWTPAQARAMAEMLPPAPRTHADVAERLGITRQAVDQALASAGWHALSAALDAIEAAP